MGKPGDAAPQHLFEHICVNEGQKTAMQFEHKDGPIRRIATSAVKLAGIAGIFFVVGSCAPATPGAAALEPTTSRGTILAMRPVLPGGAGTGVLNSLASLAAATAGQPQTAADAGQPIDYIVREAGGGTIAIVQTDELHLKVGDPVLIVRSDRTRLTRPGA